MDGIICLYLTIFSMPLLAIGACPEGYVDVNGNCFFFSEEEVTFDEAVSACESHDGDLIILEDEETKAYVHMYSDQPYTYWIHPCSTVVDHSEAQELKYICEPKCVETFEGGSEDEPCMFDEGQCQSSLLPCAGVTLAGKCGDQDMVCCLPPDPAVPWRPDGRCGPDWSSASGVTPGQCDPESDYPCCSNYGFCGATPEYCNCDGCVDYRVVADEGDGGDDGGGGDAGEGGNDDNPIIIVPRGDWGAVNPTGTTDLRLPVPMVVIHHTAACSCNCRRSCTNELRRIQRIHMNDNGWADIGYNFLIGADGSVYEGRGWDLQGAHARNVNRRSIGICVFGNFMTRRPTDAALAAAQDLIAQGVAQRKIAMNYLLCGHRDVGATDCPGNIFYDLITAWPNFAGGDGGECTP